MDNKNYIAGLLAKDSKILEAIYKDFGQRISQYIIKNNGTAEDAKDVFQDALMIIYKKAQSADFQLNSQFYTYLYSVCRFVWANKLKKKSNNTVTFSGEEKLISEESLEVAFLKREQDKIYYENFSRLGALCQNLLKLFFTKTPMTEIAKKLDLKNEHTARTKKYRCQKELENFMKQDVRFQELMAQPEKTNNYGTE